MIWKLSRRNGLQLNLRGEECQFSSLTFNSHISRLTLLIVIEKFSLAKWLKRWNLTPFVMMYFTYRDVEVKTGEVASVLFKQGRDQFSILKFDPKYDDVLYLHFVPWFKR